MRFRFMRMLVPGMKVREFMYRCYQESIRIKIVIYRDAMALASVRGPVIAKFTVPVSRNF